VMYCSTADHMAANHDGCHGGAVEDAYELNQASLVAGSSMPSRTRVVLDNDCADHELQCRELSISSQAVTHCCGGGRISQQIVMGTLRVGVQQATFVVQSLGKLWRRRQAPYQVEALSRRGTNSHHNTRCRSNMLALSRSMATPSVSSTVKQDAPNVFRASGQVRTSERRSAGLAAKIGCVHGNAGCRTPDGQRAKLEAHSSLAGVAAHDEPSSQLVVGRIVAQPADGSCLFHSIAYGLNNGTTGAKLRKEIAAFIRQHPTYKIADTSIAEWVKFATGQNVHVYARQLGQTRTWGGALEMALAGKLKLVNIHVYEHNSQGGFRCITTFRIPEATHTVHMVYHTLPYKHYDALVIDRVKTNT